jgi:PAS domain S-box-containing protein
MQPAVEQNAARIRGCAFDLLGGDSKMDAAIRILVVDDDVDTARGTCRLLEQAGYETTVAYSGTEALAMVRAGRPHLVLLDWQLPDLDGLEVCRQVKNDPALMDTCIVIASAQHTLSDEQSSGLESGADGYIVRPVANRELLARVEAFVRMLRKGRSLREKAEALLRQREASLPSSGDDETQQLLYELQVHEVELEIQGDQLRRAQGELELSRDRYARLFDEAPVGYVLLDRAGSIRQANHALGELLGRPCAALVGQPLASFFAAEDRDGFQELLQALREGKPLPPFEAQWTRANDRMLWVELRGRLEPGPGPHAAGAPCLLVTVSDVSVRKASQQRLEQLNAALLAGNQELERFNRQLVGRELRMIELKREVNELCRRQDLPPRYAVEYNRSEDKA